MARLEDRIKYTPRGFSYIEVTPQEIFRWGGICICNNCGNQILDDNMNLCYVLTDTYCKSCWEDILKRQEKFSQEDVDYDLALQESNSLDWYRYHLDSDFRDKIIRQNEATYEERHYQIVDEDEFEKILMGVMNDET